MSALRIASCSIGRRKLLAAAAAGLAGCSSVVQSIAPAAPKLYVLTRKTTFPSDLPTVADQLLVDLPIAPAEIDSTRIALSRSPTTIDYFADAAWPDRAPAMVQLLLVESFEATGRIVGVGRAEGTLRADYVLMTELRRFLAVYDGAAAGPPKIEVRLLGRLVRNLDHLIIGTVLGERTQPAAHNSTDAIVEAFDEALGGAMKDVVSWTLRRMREDAAKSRAGVPRR
jgi:cholesterol transport system auxiliary component